ncbi:MAG: apolipoprotein N-acyltransferase [Chitinivibrionales bacterium]|nr:apolipoprotein N-acyltransferase [Chitinivibrionales bacterium]
MTILVFPSLWVLGEYGRTLGELSFPWMLIGYAWTPILPIAQAAAVGGVYALSFMTVMGNVVAWRLARGVAGDGIPRGDRRAAVAFAAAVALIAVLGGVRLARVKLSGDPARFCSLQQNLDHLHRNEHSLDSAFAAAEALVYRAAEEEPDCMVLAESSLQCFLVRQPWLARRVSSWVDSVDAPLVLGSLHWDRGAPGSIYKYKVYNTAFLAQPGSNLFERYYKIKLVPFSEELPFEGFLPILSRVNLGEADFKRGTDHTVFPIGERIRGAPLICYEVIYPAFVRRRAADSVNVLINITNDGWFGRSPGPFHHLQMARLRCVENGIGMVRCANTGISTFFDPLGRRLGSTELYERTVLCADLTLQRVPTVYSALGDWVVWFALVVALAGGGWGVYRTRKTRGTG